MPFLHRFTLFLFSLFPQIQMVALCNSRAMGEADENSDIDLFIITKKGNLWTARCVVAVLSLLLGIRRRNTHGLEKGSPEYIKRTKNKFCLSFFITEEALNLDSIRLQPNDPYLDRWIQTLIPLVNKDATYERFMEANDPKASVILGRVNPPEEESEDPGIQVNNNLCEASNIIQKNNDPIIHLDSGSNISLTSSMKISVRNDGRGPLFENLIKKLWLKKTLRTYEKLGKPWGVVISDTMLKFHDKDQREVYRDTLLRKSEQ